MLTMLSQLGRWNLEGFQDLVREYFRVRLSPPTGLDLRPPGAPLANPGMVGGTFRPPGSTEGGEGRAYYVNLGGSRWRVRTQEANTEDHPLDSRKCNGRSEGPHYYHRMLRQDQQQDVNGDGLRSFCQASYETKGSLVTETLSSTLRKGRQGKKRCAGDIVGGQQRDTGQPCFWNGDRQAQQDPCVDTEVSDKI
jgi:hypothetical protein